ncbi:MAG: TIGR00730 family Rossman fold protein [Rubrobacteraceae bacterium]
MKAVCVFCGSSGGLRDSYAKAARRMGAEVSRRGIRLIYGGGKVGLMGEVAGAALAGGGEVIGVIPRALLEKEISHEGLSKLYVVGSMHERKKLMADLSDGFIALPDGYGTFEEFLEVLSWAQLSIHEKPCGLLDVDGFYEPLSALFDKAVEEGFVQPGHRSLVLNEEDPGRLLDAMDRYEPPETKKWIGPREL